MSDTIVVIQTADGSPTLYSEQYSAHYHSTHGAIQESEHVYINSGLNASKAEPVRVFEMGLGTGIDVILSARWAEKSGVEIDYTAIELHPLTKAVVNKMDTSGFLSESEAEIFQKIHTSNSGEEIELTPHLKFKKLIGDMRTADIGGDYDVVYYDAFAPSAQADLWTADIFTKLFDRMNPRGILTTYCCKGDVRRTMISVGFEVEKLAGPPGKREILRATKG